MKSLAMVVAVLGLAACNAETSTGSVAAKVAGVSDVPAGPVAASPVVGATNIDAFSAMKVLLVDDALIYATGGEALFKWKSLPRLTVQATPQSIYMDYRSNEIAANRKYKGQGVLITGTVKSVQSESANTNYVEFVAPGFTAVRGYLAAQMTDEAASYRQGQPVELGCMGMGKDAIVIMFDGCVSQANLKGQANLLVEAATDKWLQGLPSTISADNPNSSDIMKNVYGSLAALPADSACLKAPTFDTCKGALVKP